MQILIYGNELFAYDMAWGFRQAGHETIVINSYNSHEVMKRLQNAAVELVVTLGAPLELSMDVLGWLKKERPSGMRHVHWDTDGISSADYDSASGEGIEMDVIYASEPDLVLTMCPEMLELLRKKRIPCGLMHYAYSSLTHHPMPELYDAATKRIHLVGNAYVFLYGRNPGHYRYHSMRVLLKPLVEQGYNVHVYSDPDYMEVANHLEIKLQPENFHNRIPYGQTCSVYNSAYINLITQNHTHTITKRTFEIMGSGGFAMSADSEAVRQLFVPGRHLAISTSAKETLELAEHYLQHPDEAQQVRQNALEIMKNHTYQRRAEYIVQKLFAEQAP